jgi:diadenosine tetraphosphate (Ap4A) HIT family hydrolase
MTENWKSSNWDALVSGESCPLCSLISSAQQEDDHGIAIADLTFSRLFLAKNQFVKGYCVLICHRHVIEPYELTTEERTQYFDDLATVGSGLQKAFRADKMNYNLLGNVIPHLHTHILPRYFTDSAPNRPVDPGLKGHEVYLSDADYADRIALIRAQIAVTSGVGHTSDVTYFQLDPTAGK